MTTPGLPVAPIQPPSSFEIFRPQITTDFQAQRLGFSGGFAGTAPQLAGGLFGLFGVSQSQLNIFQLCLALGGAAPALGIFPDLTNVGIDLLAFDFQGAAVDSLSALPAFGLGTAPMSIGRRISDPLEDLARFRGELGLRDGEGTLACLDIGDQRFYGINAHGQNISLKVNPITRTHAEADVFQQAFNAGV